MTARAAPERYPDVPATGPHCELVFTRLHGTASVTVRGPETRARPVHCPANGEWFAIRLKPGTFFRSLPARRLIDGNDVTLPVASRDSFWLHGERWEFPEFENAETFVTRLKRADLIARDATVAAAIEGDEQVLSLRSIQRRFLAADGWEPSWLLHIRGRGCDSRAPCVTGQ